MEDAKKPNEDTKKYFKQMKTGPNILAVWLWSALAAILVTLSGIWFEFNYETNWAYFGIGLVCVGLTIYSLISRKS